MRHLDELLRPVENAGHKPQRQIGDRDRLFARALMREHAGQQCAQPMPVQKTGEGEQPGAPGNFLIGEADLDGLLGCLEFNEAGHCWVSRFPCGN